MNNKKTIALMGSCLVKDPFTTFFNKDYKEFYDVKILDQKHSIISLLQKKVPIDETLLDIYPKNPANNFQSRCLKEDFNKSFIDRMIKEQVDYLIMDIFFGIGHGILYFDGNIITNDGNMQKTQFYENLSDFKVLSLIDNPNEYFKIWKKYCDEFFNFLEIHCPNTKVILAQSWVETKVLKDDGTIYVDDIFIQRSNTHNPLYEKLENYILENFDVYFLDIDKDNLICNENHVWGKFYVHYTDDYYVRFYEKVGEIIKYDELRKKYERKFIKKHLHESHDIFNLDSILDNKSSVNHVHREFSKNQLRSIQKIISGEGIYKNVSFDVSNFDVDSNHMIKIFNIKVQDNYDCFVDVDLDKVSIFSNNLCIDKKMISKFKISNQGFAIPAKYFGVGCQIISIKYDETFSDNQLIYIKDSKNVFSYDVWLGSSFSKDISSFDKFQVESISSTDEWADIGERSVKVVCNGKENYQALVTPFNNVNIGDIVSCYVTVYNPEDNVTVRLFERDSASFKDIIVGPSSTPQRVKIVKEAITNIMQLLLISRTKQTFYADNFVFIIENENK